MRREQSATSSHELSARLLNTDVLTLGSARLKPASTGPQAGGCNIAVNAQANEIRSHPVRAGSALLAPSARAYEAPARLNEVARVYSLGVGEVRCPSQAEWDAYYGSAFAWGSTNLREDHSTLSPAMCEGALGSEA